MYGSRIDRKLIDSYSWNGWEVFPLPARSKEAPPVGVTGWNGKTVTRDQVSDWYNAGKFDNMGVKLPMNVVGLDVDTYTDKKGVVHDGAATLVDRVARFGELPATLITTRMPDRLVSGTRLFVVPGAFKAENFAEKAGPGIDVIRPVHRYTIPAPSIHPDGDVYRVFLADGSETDRFPRVDTLAELPEEWCKFLADQSFRADRVDAAPADVRAFLDAMAVGVPDEHVQRLTERYINELMDTGVGGRHDAMVRQTLSLLHCAREGHPGVGDALEQLKNVFVAETGRDEWEVTSAIESGVGLALAKPAIEVGMRRVRGEHAPLLPESFWQRPVHAHIRQAAWSCDASGDAVFLSVLARLSAALPHGCRVNTGVRTPTAMNLYVAVVGESGGGKSTAKDALRRVFPRPAAIPEHLDYLQPGSGEGLAQAYLEHVAADRKEGLPAANIQKWHNAFYLTSEAEGFINLMYERSGSTLAQQVRSAWSGEALGTQNASAETKRRVPEGSYSLGFVFGFQPDVMARLFGDDSKGTPQRFLCVPSTDPEIDDAVFPGALEIKFPRVATEFCLENGPIRDALKQKQRALARGEAQLTSKLDSQRDALIARVAGLLMILDGRLDMVTADDWSLAVTLVDTCSDVRDYFVKAQEEVERAKKEVSNKMYADREVTKSLAVNGSAKAVARVASRMCAHLADPENGSTMTRGALRKKFSGDDKKFFDSAVDLAEENGWVEINDKYVSLPTVEAVAA